MAVRIRLMRMGSKRRPFYRFVVADSRGKRDGGFLDQVGFYNPIERPQKIEVDEDKVFDWLTKGAQLSDGARSLLKKTGTLARWDAKRTGREAPDKTLPTEEIPPAAPPPEGAVAEEAAPEQAAVEKPPEGVAATEADEAKGQEKPAEAAPEKEPPAGAAPEEDVSVKEAAGEEPASGEASGEEKAGDAKETESK